jgi:hypothetical protein
VICVDNNEAKVNPDGESIDPPILSQGYPDVMQGAIQSGRLEFDGLGGRWLGHGQIYILLQSGTPTLPNG